MKGFSEAYLAELGRVIAGWSMLEYLFLMKFMSDVVMRGASGIEVTPEVTKLMGSRLLDQLKAYRQRLNELKIVGPKRVQYERAFNKLIDLRRRRDEIAHSQLSPIVGSGDVAVGMSKSWKNARLPELKCLSHAEAQSLSKEIEQLYWELFDLKTSH